MLPIKILRGDSEVFTPNRGGMGYFYSRNNSKPQHYGRKTWDIAVDTLKTQRNIRMIYAKPFNKEDWL